MHTHISSPIVCPVCGNSNPGIRYRRHQFCVYICSICDLAFVQKESNCFEEVDPVVAESLGQRYMQEVFIDRHNFWISHWEEQYQKILPFIASPAPRVLDIGCGMGHFLAVAKQHGAEAIGVETSKDQADYASAEFGVDVYADFFENVEFLPHSFDLITLWSVIEHVSQPKEFILKVHDLLKPDGLLVIKTPNQNSLISNICYWIYMLSKGHYMLPIYSDEHIFRFSVKAINNLLDITKFDLLHIEKNDNLKVMQARMQLESNYFVRSVVLGGVHVAAKIIGKENQILVFARPLPSN